MRDHAAIYGVHNSLLRAIIAKNRDCAFLMAVLYPVHNQEESGPVMMYCFIGLFAVFEIDRLCLGARAELNS